MEHFLSDWIFKLITMLHVNAATEYKQTTQIIRIESVRNTKGSQNKESPLLAIMLPAVGISFQKISDMLKH